MKQDNNMEQDDNQEQDSFLFKSRIKFAITSKTILPEVITNKLNITPSIYFKKGDTYISKHSGSVIERPHNLWEIRSETTIIEEESISHHIEYFKSLFKGKEELLKGFKNDPACEDVGFLIWVETNDAGIWLDISDSELLFLHSISNGVSMSMLANKSIKKDQK